jgi:hypothetical protein
VVTAGEVSHSISASTSPDLDKTNEAKGKVECCIRSASQKELILLLGDNPTVEFQRTLLSE